MSYLQLTRLKIFVIGQVVALLVSCVRSANSSLTIQPNGRYGTTSNSKEEHVKRLLFHSIKQKLNLIVNKIQKQTIFKLLSPYKQNLTRQFLHQFSLFFSAFCSFALNFSQKDSEIVFALICATFCRGDGIFHFSKQQLESEEIIEYCCCHII
ncbi:Hypothetical_protein [Hexamita inflata]|uniref:Hypothetical_protein n=1 Tax=Hexamita inflata TaxID=28002 RepID=A0AA86PLG8_9EUKA|nr:Hypothetical protein HINF_LOCUS26888 [Hexamita inflata]